MKILVIDIGGNSVKVLVTGETDPRKFPSGPTLTPRQMVSGVLKLTEDWKYDAVSIGYPTALELPAGPRQAAAARLRASDGRVEIAQRVEAMVAAWV